MKLILVLLVAIPALAQQPTAAELAKRVDAHYNRLQSLQARYTERYQGMGMDRSETGTLTLQKPGRMRWAYDSPAGKLFLLDGRQAISYTPGDTQAERFSEKQLDDLRSPLRFLLGHTELARELDGLTLTLVSDKPARYSLAGTPTGRSQRLHRISLTVDASGQIQGLSVEEADGAVTTFTFTAMRENLPAAAGEFTFTPPPGVTVVNGAAPM
jgi:outer membrane lipoprotein carrier protein